MAYDPRCYSAVGKQHTHPGTKTALDAAKAKCKGVTGRDYGACMNANFPRQLDIHRKADLIDCSRAKAQADSRAAALKKAAEAKEAADVATQQKYDDWSKLPESLPPPEDPGQEAPPEAPPEDPGEIAPPDDSVPNYTLDTPPEKTGLFGVPWWAVGLGVAGVAFYVMRGRK